MDVACWHAGKYGPGYVRRGELARVGVRSRVGGVGQWTLEGSLGRRWRGARDAEQGTLKRARRGRCRDDITALV